MNDNDKIDEIFNNFQIGWSGPWEAYLDGTVEARTELLELLRAARQEAWTEGVKAGVVECGIDRPAHLMADLAYDNPFLKDAND